MRTSYGNMDIAIPRDRKGEYEPQLIPKYQNTVTQDMEEKIMPLVKEWADRAENQNLVSALSITINKILCQFLSLHKT